MAIAYGLDVQPDNDPYINTSEEAIHLLDKEFYSNLVDVLPILKHVPEWMPGAGFQTRAREGRRLVHRLLEDPFKAAKDRIVCESLQLSLLLQHLFPRIAVTTCHRSSHIAIRYLIRGLTTTLIIIWKSLQSKRQQGRCTLEDPIRQEPSWTYCDIHH